MHASLAPADRAVVLVRLDTAGAIVTHAAARHLLPLSILHDRVHHVLISTHAWRVLRSQVYQIRLHTKQFCTNAMYPTATTTTSPLPLPLSLHGTLFLSVAISTIKRQSSRKAAFFHMYKGLIFEGLRPLPLPPVTSFC